MGGYKLRAQGGFSLIEVLVALTILAVGLLGLAMFQITAIKGNAIASKWTVATELAQDRIERFRHVAWDNNLASSSAGGFTTGPPPAPNYANLPGAAGDNTIVRGTQYYRVWYVNPTPGSTNTFTTITVWCCWQDESSVWHNVMLVTQRTNVGGM
ncbi:MAG: prepilin-type N-terminal cleavage/methylation domain-containing protein [Desulfobacteria bacterium]|nr:prepilin-type N-terminal cleavage/methylation domain-containing protein [Deltaproteobacteria bacterium]